MQGMLSSNQVSKLEVDKHLLLVLFLFLFGILILILIVFCRLNNSGGNTVQVTLAILAYPPAAIVSLL